MFNLEYLVFAPIISVLSKHFQTFLQLRGRSAPSPHAYVCPFYAEYVVNIKSKYVDQPGFAERQKLKNDRQTETRNSSKRLVKVQENLNFV